MPQPSRLPIGELPATSMAVGLGWDPVEWKGLRNNRKRRVGDRAVTICAKRNSGRKPISRPPAARMVAKLPGTLLQREHVPSAAFTIKGWMCLENNVGSSALQASANFFAAAKTLERLTQKPEARAKNAYFSLALSLGGFCWSS